MLYLIRKKVYRRFAVMMLHISFIVILIGAMTTLVSVCLSDIQPFILRHVFFKKTREKGENLSHGLRPPADNLYHSIDSFKMVDQRTRANEQWL